MFSFKINITIHQDSWVFYKNVILDFKSRYIILYLEIPNFCKTLLISIMKMKGWKFRFLFRFWMEFSFLIQIKNKHFHILCLRVVIEYYKKIFSSFLLWWKKRRKNNIISRIFVFSHNNIHGSYVENPMALFFHNFVKIHTLHFILLVI